MAKVNLKHLYIRSKKYKMLDVLPKRQMTGEVIVPTLGTFVTLRDIAAQAIKLYTVYIFIFERGFGMAIELVHIGFGNILTMNRVIAISPPNSAPIKRIIQESRNKGLLIDMTNGRKTKAVIFTDSGHIVLAALAPETITGRSQTSRINPIPKPELIDEKTEL